MPSITITWEPADGAEPSNCFDGFRDKVFNIYLDPTSYLPIVWDCFVEQDGEYFIRGWVHDPKTGNKGEYGTIPFRNVHSVKYL